MDIHTAVENMEHPRHTADSLESHLTLAQSSEPEEQTNPPAPAHTFTGHPRPFVPRPLETGLKLLISEYPSGLPSALSSVPIQTPSSPHASEAAVYDRYSEDAGLTPDVNGQAIYHNGPGSDGDDQHSTGHRSEEDEAHPDSIHEHLTPFPDSPADSLGSDTNHTTNSPLASLAEMPAVLTRTNSPQDHLLASVNTPKDEIVVGSTHAKPCFRTNHTPRDIIDPGYVAATDTARNWFDGPSSSHHPKRKRSSLFSDLNEANMENSLADEDLGTQPKAPRRGRRDNSSQRALILGFWRDSDALDAVDKHAVVGFIDARDRLRTRIQPTNRQGKDVSRDYPLPPGPGGGWVAFERVAFDPHLVNLDHNQVKEYVRVRTETFSRNESPEETEKLDKEAVDEAVRRVDANPPPDTALSSYIAYGPQLPPHAPSRPRKRRSTALGFTPPAAGSSAPYHAADGAPRSHPTTSLLLGYWKSSSAEDPKNKHAVYGTLGRNNMLRARIARETRDGRPMVGNFPTGAGGLWIHWDEVVFEDNLKPLSRAGVKEYCLIRRDQLDQSETPDEKKGNELKAIREAMERTAGNPRGRRDYSFIAGNGINRSPSVATNHHNGLEPNSSSYSPSFSASRAVSTHPTRDSEAIDSTPDTSFQRSRNDHDEPDRGRTHADISGGPRVRRGLPGIELRAANRPRSRDALERTNSLARREVARAEAAQMRADRRAASREASAAENKAVFDQNIKQLNRVWMAQETSRLRAEGAPQGAPQGKPEDVKVHDGVKYERKQNGPFEGKLASKATLLSIDGEDFVEYRVLMKPTFF